MTSCLAREGRACPVLGGDVRFAPCFPPLVLAASSRCRLHHIDRRRRLQAIALLDFAPLATPYPASKTKRSQRKLFSKHNDPSPPFNARERARTQPARRGHPCVTQVERSRAREAGRRASPGGRRSAPAAPLPLERERARPAGGGRRPRRRVGTKGIGRKNLSASSTKTRWGGPSTTTRRSARWLRRPSCTTRSPRAGSES